VTPAGTEHAGFQHTLASIVNGVPMAGARRPKRSRRSSPAMVVGVVPSAVYAGTADVGVRSTSMSR
jgi:hypothetical protein